MVIPVDPAGSRETGDQAGFRSLEVDDQLELGRQLDRQVARLGALEDGINIRCRAVSACQCDDEVAMGQGDIAWQNDQGALRMRECIDCTLDVGSVAHAGEGQLHPE